MQVQRISSYIFTFFSLILLPLTLITNLGVAATSTPGVTVRVSVATDGTQSTGSGKENTLIPSVSDNGYLVAFASDASNLSPNDTNNVMDIFIHDRTTGETSRISLGHHGVQANNASLDPVLSGNGRYVIYESLATNLTPNTGNHRNILLFDRFTYTTDLVSIGINNEPPNNDSGTTDISEDGNFVVFASQASNLVAGDTNGHIDIFLRNRQTNTTTRVSMGVGGVEANEDSIFPVITRDGRYIAFTSRASNLVTGDTNGFLDVFIYDRITEQLQIASLADNEAQANDHAMRPRLSDSGNQVVFESIASNLVPNDTNNQTDIFLRDLSVQTTTLISRNINGISANAFSEMADISGDGTRIVFDSLATDLVSTPDINADWDTFLYDRTNNLVTLLSVSSTGIQANALTKYPFISKNGQHITYMSDASNLVAGDTNGITDIFVHDISGEPLPPSTWTKVAVLVHGWQGMYSGDNYRYKCEEWDTRIIEFHDDKTSTNRDTETDLDNVAQHLATQGYRIFLARYTTGSAGTSSMTEAGDCLKNQISQVLQLPTVLTDNVVIVSHSMGGIASRNYIESWFSYDNNVSHFISYGTPHGGINAINALRWLTPDDNNSDYCFNHEGVCDITAARMDEFNLQHYPRDGVAYDLLGGTGQAPGWWDLWNEGIFDSEGSHDGFIGSASATGYRYVNVGNENEDYQYLIVTGSDVQRWQSNNTHASVFEDGGPVKNYFSRDENDIPLDCLDYFLSNGTSGNCEPYQESGEPFAPDDELSPQATGIIRGTIAPDETITLPVFREGEASVVTLAWNHGNLDMNLRTPDGTLITPGTVNQLPGGTYSEMVFPNTFPYATYSMTDTDPGLWEVILTAQGSSGNIAYTLSGVAMSPIKMTVDSPPVVNTLAPVTLTTYITNDKVPASGASVTGWVEGIGTLSFAEQVPGQYVAMFTAPPSRRSLYYEVQADRTGSLGFSRAITGVLHVAPESEGISIQNSAEEALDTNANGLFDLLQVTITANVSETQSYQLLGVVLSPQGLPLTQVTQNVPLTMGVQTLRLDFSGVHIGQSGQDGPYRVNLRIYEANSSVLLINAAPLLITAPYSATQFEGGTQPTETPTPTGTTVVNTPTPTRTQTVLPSTPTPTGTIIVEPTLIPSPTPSVSPTITLTPLLTATRTLIPELTLTPSVTVTGTELPEPLLLFLPIVKH